MFSAPPNCIAKNTEYDAQYVGDLVYKNKFPDVGQCRAYCTTKGAKYFTWYDFDQDHGPFNPEDCHCKNAYTERRQEDSVISGNTNLSACNGE